MNKYKELNWKYFNTDSKNKFNRFLDTNMINMEVAYDRLNDDDVKELSNNYRT